MVEVQQPEDLALSKSLQYLHDSVNRQKERGKDALHVPWGNVVSYILNLKKFLHTKLLQFGTCWNFLLKLTNENHEYIIQLTQIPKLGFGAKDKPFFFHLKDTV